MEMTPTNTIKFTKMHGAGNDFVVLDNRQGQVDLTPSLVRRLADRHLGVGADQILIVESSEFADFKYRIFNADGQEVQQCGNGARCFAQFVFDNGFTQKKQINVETLAGIIQPELIEHNWVKVDMGLAEFTPLKVPFDTNNLESRKIGQLTQFKLPVLSGNELEEIWVAVVSMGNPHVVIFLDEPPSNELVQRLGGALESHPRFPEKVNVGFLHVIDPKHMFLRVYERGVGETLACGTGACAAAVIGMKMGLIDEHVDVVKRGGKLIIDWNGQSDGHVFMTGPAQTVFEGVFYL
jgi:diaminopimelate epimerase